MWAEIYPGIGYLVSLDREAYMPASSSCFSNPAQYGWLNCFSYPADVRPGTRTRNAAQSAQCGVLNCFSYPTDVPAGSRTRNAAQSAQYGWLGCFSYPADVPPDRRGM
jgi:hypothetical protein